MPVPHCPHCQLAVGDAGAWPYPVVAMRCPSCRLIIGAGRARSAAPRSSGSAAGVLANAARRDDGVPIDPALVIESLTRTAEREGTAIDRLRLIDYDAARRQDPSLPDLGAVLATFGTWKTARAAAARRQAALRASGNTLSA